MADQETGYQFYTLSQIKRGEANRPIRVYCDGVFDLCHFGHYRLFKQAKEALLPVEVVLVIGVHSDEDSTKAKRVPVMKFEDRIAAVELSPYVHEIIPKAPFIPEREFLDEHRIDLLGHDPTPYPLYGMADMYEWVKKEDRFLPLARTEGVSTTAIIETLRKRME